VKALADLTPLVHLEVKERLEKLVADGLAPAIAVRAFDLTLAPVSSEDACDCHAAQHPAWTGCPVHGRKGPPAPVSSEPEEGK
jgi:hypothetical protein